MGNQEKARDIASKQVFTTGEAAELCNVSQQTIIRCFDSGRLNGFRVPGSKFRRIPRTDLIRFMRDNEIPSDLLDSGSVRVLIVDDDPQIIRMMEELLQDDDRFDVRAATNGYDAGMVTREFRPDVILLDYMLPDINGNVVCDRVKSNPKTRDTRIIIVSGAVDRDEITGLLENGADDFIAKPFDPTTLLGRVTELAGL